MMTKTEMTSKLKLLREEASMSHEDLVRALWMKGKKLSVGTLIRAEKGQITLTTARILAEYWGLPVADLI